MDINGEVKYDCGTGEVIFSAKDYKPTDEDELIDKDYIDCYTEFTEKSCNKRSMKLSSDDSQCCWCETIYLQGEEKEEYRKELEVLELVKLKNFYKNN